MSGKLAAPVRFRLAPLTLVAALLCIPAITIAGDWPPAPQIHPPAETDPGALPPSVSAELSQPNVFSVTFHYKPPKPVNSVALVGSFNRWARHETNFTGPDEDGVWTATKDLPVGQHSYKFLVNDQDWIPDPANPNREPDGYQGFNSVLNLGRLSKLAVSDGHVGDGEIDVNALLHEPQRPLYFQPLSMDEVLLRYRTLTNDVQRVWAAVKGGGMTEMRVVAEGPVFSFWEARVRVPEEARKRSKFIRRLEYTFVVDDGKGKHSDRNMFSSSFTSARIFETPEWARNVVWYQVMLDRFRNGDKSNDPPNVIPWTSDWFQPAPGEEQGGRKFYQYVFDRMYGGDLQGLEQELPYLKSLGVTAIYLNPIFQAEGHHKYNATNYVHVDEAFGAQGDYDQVVASEDLLDPSTWKWTKSDKVFLDFLKKAHAQGFKVIIDGVFNHVGVAHPAFQDVRKNGKSSRFADWFAIKSWDPFEYEGWAGFGSLPVFKKSDNGLASNSAKQHIFDITKRWMDPDGDGDPSDGIDGWRLDVPNEIALPFWKEWRQHVKKINPQAYIVGEIWDRADDWLDGEHFDAVMNYEFARPVIAWIGNEENKLPVSKMDQRLAELRLAYPAAAEYVMQNLVDSHDTDRLASMMFNPDRGYDRMNRIQDDNPNYNNDKPSAEAYEKARLVAFVQMTYVGAPMVYYGDEVGMWGADDPTCRKPMLWQDLQPYANPDENHVMPEQLAYYKQIIALRNKYRALRVGTFQTLVANDKQDVWAFLREDNNEDLIVIVNAAGEPRSPEIPLPAGLQRDWQVVFGDAGALQNSGGQTLTVTVPPRSGVVLFGQGQ